MHHAGYRLRSEVSRIVGVQDRGPDSDWRQHHHGDGATYQKCVGGIWTVIRGSPHLEPMAGSDHNCVRVSARPAAVATAKASCTPASTPFSKSSPAVAIVLVT